jgi:hypothetical protein
MLMVKLPEEHRREIAASEAAENLRRKFRRGEFAN